MGGLDPFFGGVADGVDYFDAVPEGGLLCIVLPDNERAGVVALCEEGGGVDFGKVGFVVVEDVLRQENAVSGEGFVRSLRDGDFGLRPFKMGSTNRQRSVSSLQTDPVL